MKISNRLYKIYEQVSSGHTAADIGTDHGYVPILLLKNKVSPLVIMSDISDKSLNKAIENYSYQDFSYEPHAYFRVGDGLNPIEKGEVDDIILAGIGGLLICSILEEDLEKARSFKKLILQPRNNSGSLRRWLTFHEFSIDKEVLSEEGKFICEIIVASPKRKYKAVSDANKIAENDIRWTYPEALKDCDKKLLRKRVGWKICSLKDEITNLKNSKTDMKQRISKLEDDILYLESLLH